MHRSHRLRALLATWPLAAALLSTPAFAADPLHQRLLDKMEAKEETAPPKPAEPPQPAEPPRHEPPRHERPARAEPPRFELPRSNPPEPQPESGSSVWENASRVRPKPPEPRPEPPARESREHGASPVGESRGVREHAASPVSEPRGGREHQATPVRRPPNPATHGASPVGSQPGHHPRPDVSPGYVAPGYPPSSGYDTGYYVEDSGPAYYPREEVVARRPPRREAPLGAIDLGFTSGLNSPGGALGAEAELRLGGWLGVGGAAGLVPWGVRLSPHVRVYVGGAKQSGSFFLQGAYSHNSGGEVNVESQRLNLRPLETANVGLGWRWGAERVYFRLAFGWQIPLRSPVAEVSDGSPMVPRVAETLAILTPGGFHADFAMGLNF